MAEKVNSHSKRKESSGRIIPITMESSSDETDTSVHPEISTTTNNETENNNVDSEKGEDDSYCEEENVSQMLLPASSVQEKIIIVFDQAQDEQCTNFVLNNGNTYPPISMLKRAVEMFLRNKFAINNSHQFALVALDQCTVSWIKGFTNKTHEILQSIAQLKECATEDVFNLNLLFDVIRKHVELPKNDDTNIAPTYVVRVILIYNRSFTVPQLTETPYISNLLNNLYFTLDVLMTHEPFNSITNFDKILSTFRQLDKKGFSYFFHVARNACELHISMAKLLAHPLQRPTQKQAKYKLEIPKP